MSLAYTGYTLVEVGCNEHAYRVLEVTKHIICATPNEHARMGCGGLAYRIALELEQTLLRQFVVVEVIV